MKSVTQRIQDYNKGRNPDFLALKYEALAESPFRFFRGTCHLFYEDLIKRVPFKDPTKAWICGDLHLENYGTYKGRNNLVYFDVNDFDEAMMAPVTWEIMRVLTSIHLAVAALKVEDGFADRLVNCFYKTYQGVMRTGKPVVFERLMTTGLIRALVAKVEKRKLKTLLAQRTNIANGATTIKIIANKTVAITDKKLSGKIMQAVGNWCKKNKLNDCEICDTAYRIAGTGSLGVDRFVVLVHDPRSRKYFLLDMKEALPCSGQPYVKVPQPTWKNNAERIVTLQYYMQNVTPTILSTVACNNKMFVIKKLQPQDDIMKLSSCNGKIKKLEEVINGFAEITASAHLRACGRKGSATIDELISFFKTSANWENKLLAYSKKYAGKVKKDWEGFCGEMNG